MQSARIALALSGLVLTFFLMLPAEPTLLSPAAGFTSTGDEPAREPPITSEAPTSTSARPGAEQGVRTVVPSPVRDDELTRLPPVSSGAGSPPEDLQPTTEASTSTEQAATEPPSPADPTFRLFARPIAVDARVLKAGETTLRVAGVEPFAQDMRCTLGTQTWPCATRARTALRGWLRGRSVLCRVPADGADGRDLTVPCLLGEEDVGGWLVSNGWARAEPGSRYEATEREAQEARRGIWAYDIEGGGSPRSGG